MGCLKGLAIAAHRTAPATPLAETCTMKGVRARYRYESSYSRVHPLKAYWTSGELVSWRLAAKTCDVLRERVVGIDAHGRNAYNMTGLWLGG